LYFEYTSKPALAFEYSFVVFIQVSGKFSHAFNLEYKSSAFSPPVLVLIGFQALSITQVYSTPSMEAFI
tara:strand:+ start:8138 stop:8344 length:207 start_codon:yes stop_codon:yes gene_type:complete